MAKTLSEVSRDAAELPTNEQLALARILLDLAEDAPKAVGKVEEASDSEIRKRVAELRSGQVKAVPFDEVRKKIGASLRKQTSAFNF
jgi:putative addiction module component (TIGR02574 family)